MEIPRVIIQTSKEEIIKLPLIQQNIEKIKNINPNWKYRLFLEKDVKKYILFSYGPLYLYLYLSINPKYGPARADFFRYLYIYKHGGVYLDIKSTINKNLDKVLRENDSIVLSHWDDFYKDWGKHNDLEGEEFVQWFIISKPKNKILKLVIEEVIKNIKNYNQNHYLTGKNGVLRLTGPVLFSRIIYENINKFKFRLVNFNDLGLKYSIYDQENKHQHHTLEFPNHYTYLREPIVISPKVKLKKLIATLLKDKIR